MRSLGSISHDLCEMQRLHDHNIRLRDKDLEWQRRIVGAAAAAKVAPPPPPPSDLSLSFALPQTSNPIASLPPTSFHHPDSTPSNTRAKFPRPNTYVENGAAVVSHTGTNNFVNNAKRPFQPPPTSHATSNTQRPPPMPTEHRPTATLLDDGDGDYDGDVDVDHMDEDEHEHEDDEHSPDGEHHSELDDNFRESSPMSADSEPSSSTTRDMSPADAGPSTVGDAQHDHSEKAAGKAKGRGRPCSSNKRSMTTVTHSGKVGKIRRHRMTKEEEARFNPADLVDLSGSTAAKSRKMTDEERDIMLHKRRLRNRASAARSRDKQRKTINDLSDEMDDLMTHSKSLLTRCIAAEGRLANVQAANDALSKENADLRQNSLLLLSPSGSTGTIPPLPTHMMTHSDRKNGSGRVSMEAATVSTAQGPPLQLQSTQQQAATPPQQQGQGQGQRRKGSLVVSMSSDMLNQIRNLTGDAPTQGTQTFQNGQFGNGNSHNGLTTTPSGTGANPVVCFPSKVHVSVSTDNLQQDAFGGCGNGVSGGGAGGLIGVGSGSANGNGSGITNGGFPRNFSVMERLLELSGSNASFDINCDVHVRE